MSNRRRFLQGISAVPLLGGAAGPAKAAPMVRDYFSELGVRPFLNAAGTYTMLTASLMPPEVVQAYEYASKRYVRLNDLHDAVGKRIAEMVGCEAAMVTAGAASALTLGTAACLTGTNQEFIRRLPGLTGMKTEVIVQKIHRVGYDHAVRNTGIKLIEVDTAEQLERAIGPQTAMLLFFNLNEPAGQIKAPEFISIAKKHNIPTFNDAAADVPPVENLSAIPKRGFDLVAFSGGKGLRGPQSAGLLLGRKDLIEAARLNGPPNGDAIGRGMKVNKEELLGMMVAVESYTKRDHNAEWKEWERRIGLIEKAVKGIPTVTTETYVPEIANHVPHMKILWDKQVVKATVQDVQQKLREGEPSIEVTPSNSELTMNVWMLQPGDAEIVARRVREVLQGAAKS
jgi:D-glucosaminate-6-phosphate ammonia-lyase